MFKASQELLDSWEFGKHGQRPVLICASINTPSFGEFIFRLLYVNTIAQQFDRSYVTLIYRNNAPFKRDLIRLLPLGFALEIPEDQFLPGLDLLSPRNMKISPEYEAWFSQHRPHQDLVITEGMANELGLPAFDHIGYLRIPEEDIQACTQALIDRGVDPNRWFCTMHARESGYPTAARGRLRNSDLNTFWAAARHIIDNLGGQVVRLGHPEMTKFKSIPGLIQLGLEPDTTLLQAFAVSRARYMVCGPSGPLAFADAFHVPTAYSNVIDVRCSNDRAVLRTIDLQAPDGTIINQERFAHETIEGVKPMRLKGYIPLQISREEMIRLVNRVHEKTTDTLGWRVPDPPYAGPRPNNLVWPGRLKIKSEFLAVPEW